MFSYNFFSGEPFGVVKAEKASAEVRFLSPSSSNSESGGSQKTIPGRYNMLDTSRVSQCRKSSCMSCNPTMPYRKYFNVIYESTYDVLSFLLLQSFERIRIKGFLKIICWHFDFIEVYFGTVFLRQLDGFPASASCKVSVVLLDCRTGQIIRVEFIQLVDCNNQVESWLLSNLLLCQQVNTYATQLSVALDVICHEGKPYEVVCLRKN